MLCSSHVFPYSKNVFGSWAQTFFNYNRRHSSDPCVRIRTTTALLKCTAVPRNFNKDRCRETSLRGGERRRQTFKLSPQGVHSDPQGNNLLQVPVLKSWPSAWVHSGAALRATEDCWEGHSMLSKINLHETFTEPPSSPLTQQAFFCVRSFLLQLQRRLIQSICSSSLCLTMALPVVVFLLALTSLSAASAPDCKDLVKPFMPEDPKLVGYLILF